MKLNELLSKLSDNGITVNGKTEYSDDGLVRITLSTDAVFPFPEDFKHWHTITISTDQNTVSEEEIETILRNLWKGSIDISEW